MAENLESFDAQKTSIFVTIRVRPFNEKEQLSRENACVRIEANNPNSIRLETNSSESRLFCFDYIAHQNIPQYELFNKVAQPAADSCLEGYNGCIFAYGQTGAGKTYTISGSSTVESVIGTENEGMLPRVLKYIFNEINKQQKQENEEKVEYLVKCSYLEIYNEHIIDLLGENGYNLQLREDIKKGVYVDGLTEIVTSNFIQALEILKTGGANRHNGETSMNRESSRSHSVFSIILQSKSLSEGVTHIKYSRFHFVDLAGSERNKQTNAIGDRLKEGCNINKSLSILGNVINALVEVDNGRTRYIHYRDSKLTFLLKDSLGGNSKTRLIANISPASSAYYETLSTLKFAKRAKLIKNRVQINEDHTGNLEALNNEIKKLKIENLQFRDMLAKEGGSGLGMGQLLQLNPGNEKGKRNSNGRGLLEQNQRMQESEELCQHYLEQTQEMELKMNYNLGRAKDQLNHMMKYVKKFQDCEFQYRNIIMLQRARIERMEKFLSRKDLSKEQIEGFFGENSEAQQKELKQMTDLLKEQAYFSKLFCENAELQEKAEKVTEPGKSIFEQLTHNAQVLKSIQESIENGVEQRVQMNRVIEDIERPREYVEFKKLEDEKNELRARLLELESNQALQSGENQKLKSDCDEHRILISEKDKQHEESVNELKRIIQELSVPSSFSTNSLGEGNQNNNNNTITAVSEKRINAEGEQRKGFEVDENGNTMEETVRLEEGENVGESGKLTGEVEGDHKRIISRLQRQLKEAIIKFEEANNRMQRLEKENLDLQSQLDRDQLRIGELEEQLEAIEERLEDQLSAKQIMQEELDTVTDTLSFREQELAQLKMGQKQITDDGSQEDQINDDGEDSEGEGQVSANGERKEKEEEEVEEQNEQVLKENVEQVKTDKQLIIDDMIAQKIELQNLAQQAQDDLRDQEILISEMIQEKQKISEELEKCQELHRIETDQIIQRMAKEKQELEEQLRQQISEIVMEKERVIKEIKEDQEQSKGEELKQAVEIEKKQQQQMIVEITSEKQTIQELLTQAKGSIDEKEAQINELLKEKERLLDEQKVQKEQMEAEIELKNQQIQEEKNQVEQEKNNDLERLSQEIELKKQQIIELNDTLKIKTDELMDALKKNEEYVNQIETFKKDNLKKDAIDQQNNQAHLAELGLSKQRIVALEGEVSGLKEQIMQLQDTERQLKEEESQLKEQRDSQHAAYQLAKSELEKMSEEVMRQQEDIMKKKEQLDSLKEEIRRCKLENQEDKQEISQKNMELSEQIEEYEKCLAEKKVLEEQCQKNKLEIEELSRQVSKYMKEGVKSQEQLKSLKDECSSLQQKLSEEISSNESYQHEVSALRLKIAENHQQSLTVQQVELQLKKEMQTMKILATNKENILQQQLEQANTKLESVEQTLQEKHERLQSKIMVIEEHQIVIEDINAKKELIQQELDQKSLECVNLQREMMDKISKLQEQIDLSERQLVLIKSDRSGNEMKIIELEEKMKKEKQQKQVEFDKLQQEKCDALKEKDVEVEKLKESLSELGKEIETLSEQMKGLEKKNEDQVEEIEKLNGIIQESKKEQSRQIQESKAQEIGSQKQLKEVQDLVQTQAYTLTSKDSQISSLNGQIATKDKRINELTATLDALSSRIAQLEAELDEQKQMFIFKCESMQKEADSRNEKIILLAEAKADAIVLENKQTYHDSLQESQQEIIQLKSSLMQYDKLIYENAKMQQEYEQLSEHFSLVQSQLVQAQKLSQEKDIQITNMANEAVNNQRNLNKLGIELNQKKTLLGTLNEEYQKLISQNESMQQRLQECEKQMEKKLMKAENSGKDDAKRELDAKAQLDELENKHTAELKVIYEERRQMLAQLENCQQLKANEVEELAQKFSEEISNFKKLTKNLQEQNEFLEHDNEEKDQLNQELLGKLQEFEAEINKTHQASVDQQTTIEVSRQLEQDLERKTKVIEESKSSLLQAKRDMQELKRVIDVKNKEIESQKNELREFYDRTQIFAQQRDKDVRELRESYAKLLNEHNNVVELLKTSTENSRHNSCGNCGQQGNQHHSASRGLSEERNRNNASSHNNSSNSRVGSQERTRREAENKLPLKALANNAQYESTLKADYEMCLSENKRLHDLIAQTNTLIQSGLPASKLSSQYSQSKTSLEKELLTSVRLMTQDIQDKESRIRELTQSLDQRVPKQPEMEKRVFQMQLSNGSTNPSGATSVSSGKESHNSSVSSMQRQQQPQMNTNQPSYSSYLNPSSQLYLQQQQQHQQQQQQSFLQQKQQQQSLYNPVSQPNYEKQQFDTHQRYSSKDGHSMNPMNNSSNGSRGIIPQKPPTTATLSNKSSLARLQKLQ